MRLTIIVEDAVVVIDGIGIRLNEMPSETPSNVNAIQWYDTEGSVEYLDGTPELAITELPSWANLCVEEYNRIAADVVEEEEPSAEELARSERDGLLFETDWWALSDNTLTVEQTDYRQALRDITDQSGFPNNIVWPTKP